MEVGLLFMYENMLQTKCKKNISFLMILKHYLLKLILKSASGYFIDYITHFLNLINTFFNNLSKALDVYSTYEKVLITGDFNAQEREKCLDTFLYQHELKSLNKEATCYKNPNKPSRIDLILKNSPRSFFNTETYFTGLSDCLKLVLSAFKRTVSKT